MIRIDKIFVRWLVGSLIGVACSPSVDDFFDEKFHQEMPYNGVSELRIFQGEILRFRCYSANNSHYLGDNQWGTQLFRGDALEPCSEHIVVLQEHGFQAYLSHHISQHWGIAPTSATLLLHQGEQICHFPLSIGAFSFVTGCVDKQQQPTDWRVVVLTSYIEDFDFIYSLEQLYIDHTGEKLPLQFQDGRLFRWNTYDEP